MRTTWGLVVMSALVVTGCSGGGASVSTPKDLAGALGCSSSYSADSTDELGVEQVGTCSFAGEDVRLLTFASNDARDTFVDVAKGFGSRYVTGEKYAVEVNSAGAEKQAKAKL